MSLKSLGIYLAEITLKKLKGKKKWKSEMKFMKKRKKKIIVTEGGKEHSYNQTKKKER